MTHDKLTKPLPLDIPERYLDQACRVIANGLADSVEINPELEDLLEKWVLDNMRYFDREVK